MFISSPFIEADLYYYNTTYNTSVQKLKFGFKGYNEHYENFIDSIKI